MIRLLLPLATLGACGTSVGNPTGLGATPAPGDALDFTEASALVDRVMWRDCDGVEELSSGLAVDLLAGDEVPQPASDYCELTLNFASEVRLEGVGDHGGRFRFHLDVRQVVLSFDGPVDRDAHDRLVELASPGWVSEDALGIGDGSDTVVEPGDPEHDVLVGLVRNTSGLFGDLDADGVVDEDERAAGP